MDLYTRKCTAMSYDLWFKITIVMQDQEDTE